ncbi:MAG: arginine/ornithine succinyltransferase subunit [Phycisphaerales bacterium]|nr:arginine/ornithine succinyltransferase subunit [Phycisphaerales bacterium]
MYVIRPITLDDLPALLELTRVTGFGLTTLPNDEKLLKRRIKESLRGFDKLADDDPPIGETYLFVMEHLPTKQVCGICGIVSKVGGFEPFYAYRIETSIHQSDVLHVRKEIRTLHLVEMHSGPCEIGSLFLSPEHRAPGNGRLLSLSRFLFMANYPAYFDPMVIAEMRGILDDRGHSPFWDAIGHHFFDIDLPKADYLSMVNKRFIADLMPKHPIYIPLLPKEAQAVIGEVHQHTKPALRILEDEGFECCEMVDIFEAGPVVRCALADVRAIRESRKAAVELIEPAVADAEVYLISNCREPFRAAKGPLSLDDLGRPVVPDDLAKALQIQVGDAIRFVPLRGAPKAQRYHDANVSFD